MSASASGMMFKAFTIVLHFLVAALLGGARLVWVVVRWLFGLRKGAAALSKNLHCKSCGESQPADGTWSCPQCGARQSGWVFGDCRVCKATSPVGYTPCRGCGEAIKNPLAQGERRR